MNIEHGDSPFVISNCALGAFLLVFNVPLVFFRYCLVLKISTNYSIKQINMTILWKINAHWALIGFILVSYFVLVGKEGSYASHHSLVCS
jgi:hypothetical protein